MQLLLALLLLSSFQLQTFDQSIHWSYNTAIGYKVYYGIASRVYTNVVDVGYINTYKVTGLTVGTMYYFTVTAYNYDEQGNRVESEYSEEISTALGVPSKLSIRSIKN